jgi:Flp pilus assembly pilin Flp
LEVALGSHALTDGPTLGPRDQAARERRGKEGKRGIVGQRFRSVCSRAFTRCEHERGQALIEYALILMLVATVCAAVLSQIGVNIIGPLEDVAQALV